MKIVTLGVLCGILLGAGGCVYPLARTPQGAMTTGSIVADFRVGLANVVGEPAKWTPLRRAKGSSSLHTVMGLITWGDMGTAAAYADALMNAGGDALVDCQTDVNVSHVLGIYMKITTTVSGLAVREEKGGS